MYSSVEFPSIPGCYNTYNPVEYLITAARENDDASVKSWIGSINPSTTYTGGLTLLHIAAWESSVVMLTEVLKKVPRELLDAVDNHGSTALEYAAQARTKSGEMVKALLKAGASVKCPTSDPSDAETNFQPRPSALRRSLDHKNWEAAEVLIVEGADASAVNEKLLHAARNDDYADYLEVRAALERFEDAVSPECLNSKGQTLFHVAVESRSENFLRRLFDDMKTFPTSSDAHRRALNVVDDRGYTPLMMLCEAPGDKHHLVKEFIEAGAKHDVSGTAKSVLELAYAHWNQEIAHVLIEAGARELKWNEADVDAIMKSERAHSEPPEWWECKEESNGRYAYAKLTPFEKLKRGLDEVGSTTVKNIMISAIYGDVEMLETVNNTSLRQATDELGRTAMFYAAESGNEAVVRHLGKQGLDINARSTNGTSVFEATVQNLAVQTDTTDSESASRLAMLKLLIELGANINTPDNMGYTPLMYAALAGDGAMCRMLIESNANVHAESEAGANVWDIVHRDLKESLNKLLSSLSLYEYRF
jgi:ankyrin repeat protein